MVNALIHKMAHRFFLLFTIVLLTAWNIDSKPVDQISDAFGYDDSVSSLEGGNDNGDGDYYDSGADEQANKCQNGGFNILESDWCACEPRFTGRYCEIEIEPDNRNGCGSMLNNEEDMLDCARCKCTRNLLQCTAYRCNVDVNVMFYESENNVRTNNKSTTVESVESSTSTSSVIKGSSLSDLVMLMHTIETLAYKHYVDALVRNGSYDVVFKDVDNKFDSRTNANESQVHKKSQSSSISDGLGDHDDRQRVIVFKSSPDRLLGLYFVPTNNRILISASSSAAESLFCVSKNVYIFLFIFTKLFLSKLLQF